MRRYIKKIKILFVSRRNGEIDPDEIFLDSFNLPQFDRSQFEGRLEKPITHQTLLGLFIVFLLFFGVILYKTWALQIAQGEEYLLQGEDNRLRHAHIFARRGIIYDRNGEELVWNVASATDRFARRRYISEPGFAHLLGYVTYPQHDSSGIYYQTEYIGTDGTEKTFNDQLSGVNGVQIVEINARYEIQSENTIRPPFDGDNLHLSIDARVQMKLHELIRDTANSSGFFAGAGAIMDIHTGEILALTSYPEYSSQVLSDGVDDNTIASFVLDDSKPFLNRVTSGVYTPGSIVKPYIAIGALEKGIITPEKEILSTGALTLPNPFFPDQPTVFKDWKAHGWVNMLEAIGVSSNVYFFNIGGGFEEQEGLGISGIEEYVRLFGFGEETHINLPTESTGVIPNPAWKQEHFPGDEWRVGDTYNTAIGQYGFQVSPLQALRAVAAIANGGQLIEPSVKKGGSLITEQIDVLEEHITIAQEGMRYAVTHGTAKGLQFPQYNIAAKTGTAEVGLRKSYVHSWVTGFFPYESPRYAFVVLMEKAPAGTLIGSVFVSRNILEWMQEETPEYMTPYE